MISGTVNAIGVPTITLRFLGKTWRAMIDTGFNGDLEIPLELLGPLGAKRRGSITSVLAGGQQVQEDRYRLNLPFDGEVMFAVATFVPGQEILIGTHLLRRHRLEINFVTKDVLIERVS
ncbi:MAG: hypothetical protein ABSE73_04275 [Planctomycetota bacterium]